VSSDPTNPAQKPGWTTSEFALTLAAILLLAALSYFDASPVSKTLAGLGVPAALASYVYSRTRVKIDTAD
jgi:hypothetical protein